MTSVEVKGHHGDDHYDTNADIASNGKTLTNGKLLTRPQTAAPSLRNSNQQRLHRTESSLAVIGKDTSVVEKDDFRGRVQGHIDGSPTPKHKNLDNLKSTQLKGLKFRIKSAVSRVAEVGGVEQQNIPIVGKELLLMKSLSSPNFTTPNGNGSTAIVRDLNKLDKKTASLVITKTKSKKTGLFISTEPITLAARPHSSLSISRKLRQDRPKTTSSLAHSFRSRQNSCKTPEDEKKTDLSEDAAVVEDPEKENVSNKKKDGVIYCTDSPDNEDQTIGLKTSDLRLALNLDGGLLDNDRDKYPLSNRTDQISSPQSKSNNVLDDKTKEAENIYENIKSILRSRRDNKSARTARSTASSLNPVLPLERELPPVLSPSALSQCRSPSALSQCRSPSALSQSRSPSALSQNRSPSALSRSRSTSVLSQHKGDSKPQLPLSGDHDPESSVLELKEEKTETNINCNHISDVKTPSDTAIKTYKMATVEMYEKDFVKHQHHRLSITEEIKKQNARLEEKNSDIRHQENALASTEDNAGIDKDGDDERGTSPVGLSENGNVCGSPGFKYYQDQLKNMNNQTTYMGPKRLGSGPRTLQDPNRKGSGDLSAKVSQKDKPGLDYKTLGIRPLSEHVGKTPLDNLYVAGGSCTLKNGEQAVSKAAENIATPAGVLSKVSLQQGQNKMDESNVCNENGVNVRVSLTYLKEKQGINSVGYRYRLDDYLSGKPKSATEWQKSDKKRTGRSGQALSAPQKSSGSKVNNNNNDNDDVRDSDDESSSERSSSSTPTAAFSGSELLYPNDGVHRSHGDEIAGSDIPGYERDRQKLRDLDAGNRRPASRNKKMSVVDKVSFDREREDLRTLNNSLPSKTPALRNGSTRSSLVRGEQIMTGRNGTISNSNREADDLIAMGTIWSPAKNNDNNNNSTTANNNTGNGNNSSSSAAQTRSSSNTTNSNKSIPINNSTIIGSNGFAPRKATNVSLSNPGRVNHYGGGGIRTQGGANKDHKEVEPKYSDPLAGAPASFQQRLMDLASLEAETIRWERTKKVKKKPKQDRDS